jgi:(1->4)-alpha-D-glucan 1-alpha-D-glucosylmutase
MTEEEKTRLRVFLSDKLQIHAPPVSTYRIQLNKTFPFRQAADLAPYLRDLGLEAVYCSPYFTAIPGSSHGYNVTDYNATNPELGTPEEFDAFCAALAGRGLRQVLDMVPNHMGIGSNNTLWLDVLENGPASVYAHFFDINWEPVKKELKDKVLIPVLGDLYGRLLESQELKLHYQDGAFQLRYHVHVLPIAPETYPLILSRDTDELEASLPEPDREELLSISTAFQNLPPRAETAPARVAERNREKEVSKRRLAALAARSEPVRELIAEQVRLINGEKGVPRSFDRLDDLLDQQAYRMTYWRAAADDINYRRFFDINELAATHMEDPRVFASCHELVFRLIREGKVHGLRIDHPDGLYDPPKYFRRLQRNCLAELIASQMEPAPDPAEAAAALDSPELRGATPLLIVAEKILDRKETLPEDWCIHGTVGYDFLNALNGVFVEQANEKAFSALYDEFIGHGIDFDQLVYDKKKLFALLHMASEINDLGHRLDLISEQNRLYRDFTRNNLVLAIRETIACFPVYRTYISPDDVVISERDAKYVGIAVEKAKSRTPALNPAVYDFLRDVLLLRLDTEVAEPERRLYRDFVLRFQQLTGPIMAKGMEDTAFYVFNRLISLNEVGGDPTHFGVSREDFHRQNALRNRRWPASFITTSTHDTKRGEDVRMRLDVLSEIPAEWQTAITQWSLVNKKHKTLIGDMPEPRPNTEYMIYQTLLGVWPDRPLRPEEMPAFQERLWAFVCKAIREAKIYTDWAHPDKEYEAAVQRFLSAVLSPDPANRFFEIFHPLQSRIVELGRWNSLSALTLKLGSPGIMDTYQGTELWDLNLVDPDNRRPVDFSLRRQVLAELQSRLASGEPRAGLVSDLVGAREDGRVKLYLLWQGLQFRNRHKGLLLGGDYIPLDCVGEKSEHIVAFLRRDGKDLAVVAAGRFFSRLVRTGLWAPAGEAVWKDTAILLPEGVSGESFVDVFTGRNMTLRVKDGRAAIRASEMFDPLAAAILSNTEGGPR